MKAHEFPPYEDRDRDDPRAEVERLLDEVRSAINEGLLRIQQDEQKREKGNQ